MLKRFATLVAGLAPYRKRQPVVPTLWVMTDAARLSDPTHVLQSLPPGSGLVIRHSDPVQRRALAARFIPICKARRIKTLISTDWRTAQVLNADGVHLPEAHVTQTSAGLRLWRKSKRVMMTCAAHSAKAVRRAQGCDAVFLSPVFPTRSHPNRENLGRLRYAHIARKSRSPVIALGGITLANVRALRGTHTSGVAGISFAAA